MGFFGQADGDYQEATHDNPLGLKQAPEEEAANQGQPVDDEAAVNDNVGQMTKEQELDDKISGGDNQQQQSMEAPIEKVDVNDDFDKKVAFIKQKVKSPEEFENSIGELEQKLGINPSQKNITNQEEAVNYYVQLENQLGKTSDIDETRQNYSRIQQENQRLKQMLQTQQMQNPQNMQPLRNPQTGQFMTQQQPNVNQSQQPVNQQQQGEQQQSTELSLEDVMEDLEFDIPNDEFINDIYEKGANSESFKKVVAQTSLKTAEKLVERKFQEQEQKQQQEQQQQQQRTQQAQQLNNNYKSQVDTLKQQYGEEKFESNKPDILNFFKQYPMYLDPAIFPNGFDVAFNYVSSMNSQYQQQQQVTQQTQQQNNAQKKAARIPKSQANNKMNFQDRNISQEEIEKQQIFSSGGQGGLWG